MFKWWCLKLLIFRLIHFFKNIQACYCRHSLTNVPRGRNCVIEAKIAILWKNVYDGKESRFYIKFTMFVRCVLWLQDFTENFVCFMMCDCLLLGSAKNCSFGLFSCKMLHCLFLILQKKTVLKLWIRDEYL